MDYWNECVAEAFEDAGIKATKEQIDTVASWVEGARDNYGMAHGHDAIPNPMESEINELNRRIRQLEDRHERQLNGIRKGVALRRKVNVNAVHIDDSGHVTYDI